MRGSHAGLARAGVSAPSTAAPAVIIDQRVDPLIGAYRRGRIQNRSSRCPDCSNEAGWVNVSGCGASPALASANASRRAEAGHSTHRPTCSTKGKGPKRARAEGELKGPVFRHGFEDQLAAGVQATP